MVFKALEESTAVIHDVSLVGESDVSHQIDVHVTVEGQSRRVLIECKDFDTSGDKVGLPIVRDFWAVLDDTKANEGFIITMRKKIGKDTSRLLLCAFLHWPRLIRQ
jgi:Restriction endonuclease